MKKSHRLLPLLALVLFWGCGQSSPSENSDTANTDQVSTEASPATEAALHKEKEITPESGHTELLGSYVGGFEALEYDAKKRPSYTNRINITLDEISGDQVKGHSVVAGSMRPFEGTFTAGEDGFKVEAKEPGDDKYDGKFSFELKKDGQKLKGKWFANDKKLAVTVREYDLEKRSFKYDPSLELPENVGWTELYNSKESEEFEFESTTEDVTKFNASKVKLKSSDVENMFKGDLEIIRNSIYARHGYSFKTRKMRYVFDTMVPWYFPVSTDVSKELTKLEQENIALIKRYEKHAETYYDSYGR